MMRTECVVLIALMVHLARVSDCCYIVTRGQRVTRPTGLRRLEKPVR